MADTVATIMGLADALVDTDKCAGYYDARAALERAIREALEPAGMVLVRQDVVEFLRGAGPLNGTWFGDLAPSERGCFWWRRYLPAAPTKERG